MSITLLFAGQASADDPGPDIGGGILLESPALSFVLLESGDYVLLES